MNCKARPNWNSPGVNTVQKAARYSIRWLAPSLIALVSSCGLYNSDFPNRLIGAEGQVFFLEDLEAIANNVNLTDDQKREEFRELGIEDERLINLLLEL